MMSTQTYIPALRYNWLTKFYDFLLSITFPEKKIKQSLINQLNLTGKETILDFGCGTATLSIMIKKQFPTIRVIGVDVDKKILAIAEEKIKKAGVAVELRHYDGENLPFLGYQNFDKIVSSLVFHHIPTSGKRIIFGQLYKIVKPGGELHIADFGKPENFYAKTSFALLRKFDGEENTRVNARGLLPQFIKGGGFNKVEITKSINTAFGTINLIKATDTERELRKIEFAKQENENLRGWATKMKFAIWNAIEENLKNRTKCVSYLSSDNNIFDPFIDAYSVGSIIHPMYSFFIDVGKDIYREIIIHYENENKIKVNKDYLFIAISFLAIGCGDEITAMQFWEMAQKERELTYSSSATLDDTIDLLHTKFRVLMSAIERNFNENKLVQFLKTKFTFIQDFEPTLKSLSNLSKVHFLSCGIKHVHVLGKLRESRDLSIIKVFAQELLNSLCILNENLLKEKGLTGDTIGALMVSVYRTYPTVGHFLGESSRSSGIYAIGKINFYNKLDKFLLFIENSISDADKLKADTLYALHQLRNEALHTLDDTRLYYTNIELFEKTIGLLFICVAVIQSL